MKKTAAILLIALLVFNWFGFRLLTYCLQQQADDRMEAQFDVENYDESKLISIKLAAPHLSNYSNNTHFERVDGQIEIAGIPYKFVKRRFCNDSLEFICMPNHVSMKIQAARENFFKLVNDLQPGGQGKKGGPHSGVSKNPSTEYFKTDNLVSISQIQFLILLRHQCYLSLLANNVIPVPGHPPQSQG